MLLDPRRTRTNMKLLQLVWIFLLTVCGQTVDTKMKVNEDDDAILNCSLGNRDISNAVFDWNKDVDHNKKEVFIYSKGSYYGHGQTGQDPQFEGRVFHFPDQLQFGNASIVIRKTKTSDSGTYTCYSIPSKQPEIQSIISLTVDPILKPRPEIEGASPQPIVTLHRMSNGMLLKCVVRGAFPKPEVEWWDSDGNILPADEPQITERGGNKYDVILTITATKSSDYRCVSTQKEINHQIYIETHVNVPGAASKPSVTNLGQTKDGVLLQCEVFGASPELKVLWKDKAGNLVPSKEPQKTDKGGSYDIVLQTTVTKTDYYRCVTTEGKMDDEVYSETHVVVPDDTWLKALIGVFVGFILGAVFVGAIVLYSRKKRTEASATIRSNEENGVHSPLQQDSHNNTNSPSDTSVKT